MCHCSLEIKRQQIAEEKRKQKILREIGSVSKGSTFLSRFNMTLRQHKNECRHGILEIFKAPLSSFMTIAVLAVAISLPSGFHVFLKNAQDISRGWDSQAAKITLIMKTQVDQSQVLDLKDELMKSAKIASATYISKQEGLEDFKASSGLGDSLSMLAENPLPDILVVTPSSQFNTPEAAAQLKDELTKYDQVELAKLDLDWIRKLYLIMHIAERSVTALSLLLSAAVLLIIGNTIRLAIQSRREEIQIIKLVGATDSFIRRPFLYSGLWFGLFAGLVSLVLVNTSILWLEEPVRSLAGEYSSSFRLEGLSLSEIASLLVLSTFLGLAGSWISVGRHIRDIEPR